MEFIQPGKTEIQHDRIFFCHGEKKRALEQVREAGGGHKGSQTSAGRCCHTAWLELKNGDQDFHMGFFMWGHSKVFHLIVQDVQDLSVHSFSWSMAEGVWDLGSIAGMEKNKVFCFNGTEI